MKHVIVEKSQVQPFARVVMGKVQHVKGWLMPEKYKKDYEPSTRGVMSYIQDHIGIQGYTDIIKRSALESKYIMEGVQSAFLDVTNKGRGTFEKMAKTNPQGLKPFLGAIFNHVQEDVVALRRDLRKSRTMGSKDIRPRKKKWGTLDEAMTAGTGMNREQRDKWRAEDDALWAERDKHPKGSPERAEIDKKILEHSGLKKSRTVGAKDKKPRKKGYVKYTPENLLEESKPQSHREQLSSIRRILRGE